MTVEMLCVNYWPTGWKEHQLGKCYLKLSVVDLFKHPIKQKNCKKRWRIGYFLKIFRKVNLCLQLIITGITKYISVFDEAPVQYISKGGHIKVDSHLLLGLSPAVEVPSNRGIEQQNPLFNSEIFQVSCAAIMNLAMYQTCCNQSSHHRYYTLCTRIGNSVRAAPYMQQWRNGRSVLHFLWPLEVILPGLSPLQSLCRLNGLQWSSELSGRINSRTFNMPVSW